MYSCPICILNSASFAFIANNRNFFECNDCALLFVSPDQHLSKEDEKKRYDLHVNTENDQGYIGHLEKLKDAILPKLSKEMLGLDYGCGPTPVMQQIFQTAGFQMQSYDPIYQPTTLTQTFDFITCSEVVEHFQNPRSEFLKLKSLLKPKGLLAIMTRIRDYNINDSSWWYLRDTTHYCFYSVKTFEKIAEMFNWRLDSVFENIVVFQVR